MNLLDGNASCYVIAPVLHQVQGPFVKLDNMEEVEAALIEVSSDEDDLSGAARRYSSSRLLSCAALLASMACCLWV